MQLTKPVFLMGEDGGGELTGGGKLGRSFTKSGGIPTAVFINDGGMKAARKAIVRGGKWAKPLAKCSGGDGWGLRGLLTLSQGLQLSGRMLSTTNGEKGGAFY